ncbi:MAG: CPBP family intramembrane metalloprotease [Chloroflexi bacterium]|nr:CPBP family intramembrane metalloprotease [Chloroflexota bacterium]
MSSLWDTQKKGLASFLLISFGLAWVIWEITLRVGPSAREPLFQLAILPGALAPAVAAIVVRKWVTREGFGDAGLKLNLRRWQYYVAGWALPLFVVSVILLAAVTLEISDPDFSMRRAIWQLGPPGTVAPPLPDGIFALVVIQSMVTAIVATPILFGEEFGWRGYLQVRLFRDRPLLAAVVTGVIWGLWHLPINLRGYNFPDQPVVGMLVFTVSAIMLSIIFGWLRTKTGSIWAASLGHSATNAVGGSLTLVLFIGAPNWIFVSYVGIIGWVPLGVLCMWIALTGQLNRSRTCG